MKRRKKRQRPAEPSGEEAEQEEEEEAQEALGEDAQDIEFAFCDPDEDDYHGVSELLKSGTWDFAASLTYPALTESVVGQGNIGTLIKSDAGGDDEAVCGILTVLNLRQFESLPWPGVIGKALLAKANKHADASSADKLRALLERSGEHKEVGLLLSERFANLPLELVHPLHKALLDDIEWSCNTPECPADERPFYGFTHFLGVVRCRTGAAEAQAGKKRRRGRKESAPSGASSADPGPGGSELSMRPGDEVLLKRASFSFTFPMPASRSSPGEGEEERLPDMRAVFGISRGDLQKAVAEMRSVLGAGQ